MKFRLFDVRFDQIWAIDSSLENEHPSIISWPATHKKALCVDDE